ATLIILSSSTFNTNLDGTGFTINMTEKLKKPCSQIFLDIDLVSDGLNMNKGISIVFLTVGNYTTPYPMFNKVAFRQMYSEVNYLKILIENFWCLRNALQEMIELVIEINENLEQLHESRPSKNVEDFLQYWNIYAPKTVRPFSRPVIGGRCPESIIGCLGT
ncbi:22953_t:CDS:2, partial [Gigaspora rosea]